MAVEVLLDPSGDSLAIKQTEDVQPILEQNKYLRTVEQKSDWGRHVAEIPNVLYVQWLNEEHAKGNTDLRLFTPEFDALVKKKLYDPDWAYLRVDKPALISGWMGFGS